MRSRSPGEARKRGLRLEDLPPISTAKLHERRERVFLVLAGLFLGTLAMLNIVGITRFVHIGPLALAVGVLPYPLTFLCTDFISEFYGRRRANFVVLVGVLLNFFVIGILWLGQSLPAMDFKTDLQRLPVVRQETVYTDPETRREPVPDPRNPALPLRRLAGDGDSDSDSDCDDSTEDSDGDDGFERRQR